jgi:hypothetical protein
VRGALQDARLGFGDAGERGEADGGGDDPRGSPKGVGDKVMREQPAVIDGKIAERFKGARKSLGDSPAHPESQGADIGARGGWKRPESSWERGGRREESAMLPAI